MAESLAVLYRPREFSDICGQSSVVKILKRQLELQEVKNAYLFAGASGCGKAQPLNSRVLTPNGFIYMKDICIGDTVITSKDNKGKVIGIYPQGLRDNYRITLSDGTSIEVSDEHLNCVYRYNVKKHCREDYTVTTKELIELYNNSRYDIRVDIPKVSFPYHTVQINPYLLGCLIGDGSLHGNFSFCNTEPDVIERVDNILRHDYGMYLKDKNGKDFAIRYIETVKHNDSKGNKGLHPIKYNFDITKSLKYQLQEYGLLCKSVDKHIPKDYLINSEEVRTELLKGLFDTDGYTDSRGYTNFSTSSKQLSKDFEFLVRSLGIRDTVTCKQGCYKNKNGDKIKCNISYNHRLKIPNGFSYCTSQKHLGRQHTYQHMPMRHITNIEPIGKIECQCIMIDHEDHTYISDNFIPTHNTTLARIFADQINNHSGSPIEIDAASNNGVDNVKLLIKSSQERSIDSKYKVFIVDECHMITTQGWNAFLKCIEEPPQYTIFLFCTTDPQKIPATILNRVQRFNISKIPLDMITNRLRYICEQEGYTNYEEGIQYISKVSDGGMRDAIATLEKCASYDTDLSIQNVLESLGSFSYDSFFKLINNIIDGNDAVVISIVDEIYNSGSDLKIFVDNFLNFCLDICKYAIFKTMDVVKLPSNMQSALDASINFDNAIKYYKYILDKLLELKMMLRNDSNIRDTITVTFLQMSRCQ